MKKYLRYQNLIINLQGIKIIQGTDDGNLLIVYNDSEKINIKQDNQECLLNQIMNELNENINRPNPYCVWNENSLQFEKYHSASNTNGFGKWSSTPLEWNNETQEFERK